MAEGIYRGLVAAAPPPPPPVCSCCKTEPPAPKQRYCKACHARYMREWRRRHHPIRLHALHMKQAREAA